MSFQQICWFHRLELVDVYEGTNLRVPHEFTKVLCFLIAIPEPFWTPQPWMQCWHDAHTLPLPLNSDFTPLYSSSHWGNALLCVCELDNAACVSVHMKGSDRTMSHNMSAHCIMCRDRPCMCLQHRSEGEKGRERGKYRLTKPWSSTKGTKRALNPALLNLWRLNRTEQNSGSIQSSLLFFLVCV